MITDTIETRAALATSSTRLSLAQIFISKIEFELRNDAGEQALKAEIADLLDCYRRADADYSKLARQAVAERARV